MCTSVAILWPCVIGALSGSNPFFRPATGVLLFCLPPGPLELLLLVVLSCEVVSGSKVVLDTEALLQISQLVLQT